MRATTFLQIFSGDNAGRIHNTLLNFVMNKNQSNYKFIYRYKPIFHCDAKLLVSGNFVLGNAKDSTFALPKAKNTNMLVSLVLGDANFLRWPCTFHFLCVDFICVG